jgi:hypothetical protein
MACVKQRDLTYVLLDGLDNEKNSDDGSVTEQKLVTKKYRIGGV